MAMENKYGRFFRYFNIDIQAIETAAFSAKTATINIKDYGAIGDGVTDDTAAIQTALDAANTAGGGVVLVPPKVFISSNLTIHGKTILQGTGHKSQLKALAGTTGNFISLAAPSTDIAVVIKDIQINGNNLSGLTCINFNNTGVAQDSLHRFENVYVYNAGVDGIRLGPAVIETVLIDCYVFNSGRYGYNFDVGATDNRIISCSSGKSLGHGFYVQGNNNHFIGCKSFYSGYTGTAWTPNIHGFMLYPSASQDLHLVSLVSCEAQNNSQDGFHLDATATSATITHVVVTNCMSDGNNMGNTSGAGFYVNGAQYSTFNNNTTRSQSPAHTYGLALYGNLTKTFIGANDFNGATAAIYTDSAVSGYGNGVNVLEKTVADSAGVGGIDAPFGTVAAHTVVQRLINFNGPQQYVAKYGAADWYVNNSTSTLEVNALTVAFDHIDVHGLKINNVATPVVGTDAVNKTYADTNRGIVRSINSVSANTTAGNTAATDYIYFVSGVTTITLPTAVTNTNQYIVKNIGTNTVTIATTSSQTIDGTATTTLSANTSLRLVSDATNWRSI